MKTTMTAARKAPRHADMKDCCHVYAVLVKMTKKNDSEPAY
jgi:hypothetical protein